MGGNNSNERIKPAVSGGISTIKFRNQVKLQSVVATAAMGEVEQQPVVAATMGEVEQQSMVAATEVGGSGAALSGGGNNSERSGAAIIGGSTNNNEGSEARIGGSNKNK